MLNKNETHKPSHTTYVIVGTGVLDGPGKGMIPINMKTKRRDGPRHITVEG